MRRDPLRQKVVEIRTPRGGVIRAQFPVADDGQTILREHLTERGLALAALYEQQQKEAEHADRPV